MEEDTLTLTKDQVRAVSAALDLTMKLKLGVYITIPQHVLKAPDEEYCKRQDKAIPLLKAAFRELSGGDPFSWERDGEWHTMHQIRQALFQALILTSNPDAEIDEDENLPKVEIHKK